MNGFNLEKAVSKFSAVSIQKTTSKVLMMRKRFVKIFHPWLGLLKSKKQFPFGQGRGNLHKRNPKKVTWEY